MHGRARLLSSMNVKDQELNNKIKKLNYENMLLKKRIWFLEGMNSALLDENKKLREDQTRLQRDFDCMLSEMKSLILKNEYLKNKIKE